MQGYALAPKELCTRYNLYTPCLWLLQRIGNGELFGAKAGVYSFAAAHSVNRCVPYRLACLLTNELERHEEAQVLFAKVSFFCLILIEPSLNPTRIMLGD